MELKSFVSSLGAGKKAYTAPVLTEHGKVADITRGNGNSPGDAGGTQSGRPPGQNN